MFVYSDVNTNIKQQLKVCTGHIELKFSRSELIVCIQVCKHKMGVSYSFYEIIYDKNHNHGNFCTI